jgi:hypothetical protein
MASFAACSRADLTYRAIIADLRKHIITQKETRDVRTEGKGEKGFRREAEQGPLEVSSEERTLEKLDSNFAQNKLNYRASASARGRRESRCLAVRSWQRKHTAQSAGSSRVRVTHERAIRTQKERIAAQAR